MDLDGKSDVEDKQVSSWYSCRARVKQAAYHESWLPKNNAPLITFSLVGLVVLGLGFWMIVYVYDGNYDYDEDAECTTTRQRWSLRKRVLLGVIISYISIERCTCSHCVLPRVLVLLGSVRWCSSFGGILGYRVDFARCLWLGVRPAVLGCPLFWSREVPNARDGQEMKRLDILLL